jgi:hypothetical protein
MPNKQKREKRAVRLPAEVWFETDVRAVVSGVSASHLIEKALRTYFNMTGKVALADVMKRFAPIADADVGRAIAKSRSEEDSQALAEGFRKINELGKVHVNPAPGDREDHSGAA